MKSNQEKLLLALRILLVVGMLLSLVLVYEHFSPSESEFCQFGENFDCGIVNKSPYANLDGFSYLLVFDAGLNIGLIDISGIHWILDLITANAFLGFLTLLFVFALTFNMNKGLWFVRKDKTLKWIHGLLIFGVAYGMYLVFIQHAIIKSYCILCLGLDAILISSLIVSYHLTLKTKSKKVKA